MTDHEIIIVGGGPVGLALGIELGLYGIKTVIYEKHLTSSKSPRAQLLNPRSMEFFRRWGINKTIIARKLLPQNYPIRSVWCSGMAGEVYAAVDIDETVNPDLSPEKYQRIPLWITEQVLRERLQDFTCVKLMQGYEVTQLKQNHEEVTVTINNNDENKQFSQTAQYVVGCDGAHSFTREAVDIAMVAENTAQPMMNVLFTSKDLKEKMTTPKGILYYNLTTEKPGVIGCIDYANGQWYSQLFLAEDKATVDISASLDQSAGVKFNKAINHTGFWRMQACMATRYQQKRVFLAGDALHTLPPLGGHGLNTGFGDVVNLAWKLAAIIHKQASTTLLDSYEIERRPIALQNMSAAKKNVQAVNRLRELYPPKLMPQAFASENLRIAKQHAISLGLALGYHYKNSPIINYVGNTDFPTDSQHYYPIAAPGFFAPHYNLSKTKCLYDYLSLSYTLLTIAEVTAEFLNFFSTRNINLKVFKPAHKALKSLYPKNYYLLRPDWHIAWAGDNMPNLNELLTITNAE